MKKQYIKYWALLLIFIFMMTGGKNIFKNVLLNFLTIQSSISDVNVDAVYLLGGPYISTLRHMNRAVELYKQGVVKRVYVYGSKSQSVYDPLKQRYLTRSEWVVNKMVSKGVCITDVTAFEINNRFFGTLSEARDFSKYVKSKNIKSVLLISSPYHTRRVKMAFTHYLSSSNVSVYVIPSKDYCSFIDLLFEFAKLIIYKIITLF